MASHTLPGLGLKGGYSPGDSGWGNEMVLNLLTLSAVGQLAAKSRITALPGSPTDGDIYIVPSGAGSNPNKIAVRDVATWVYLTPVAGWRAYVIDEAAFYLWNGTAWIAEPLPLDVNAWVPGAPTGSQKLLRRLFRRDVTFKDDFAGSAAKAGVAATATTVFNVQRNGTTVGTITFAAGGTSGSFATSGSGTETFSALTDELGIVAPASADATLADITILLAGTQ